MVKRPIPTFLKAHEKIKASDLFLESYNRDILKKLADGYPSKDLPDLIGLYMSAIEKRKVRLKYSSTPTGKLIIILLFKLEKKGLYNFCQFEWFFVKWSKAEWNNTETSVVSRTCPEKFDDRKIDSRSVRVVFCEMQWNGMTSRYTFGLCTFWVQRPKPLDVTSDDRCFYI